MQYRLGYATVYTDSQDVYGIDVDWTDIEVGSLFKVRGEDAWYEIANVVSATHLQLSSKYVGITQIGTQYTILKDFTPNFNLPEVYMGDIDAHWSITRAFRLIDDVLSRSTYQATGNRQIIRATNVTGATIEAETVVCMTGSYPNYVFPAQCDGDDFGPLGLVVDADIPPGEEGDILIHGFHQLTAFGKTVYDNDELFLDDVPEKHNLRRDPLDVYGCRMVKLAHVRKAVGSTVDIFFAPEHEFTYGKFHNWVHTDERYTVGFKSSDDIVVEFKQNRPTVAAYPTFQIDASGKISWGSGTSAPDCELWRANPNELKTKDILTFEGAFPSVIATVPGAIAYRVIKSGEEYPRFKINDIGNMYWGDGASEFDISLGRIAENTIGVTGNLDVTGYLSVGSTIYGTYQKMESSADPYFQGYIIGETYPRFEILSDGTITFGDGESEPDCRFWREKANEIRTDDNFTLYLATLKTLNTVGGVPSYRIQIVDESYPRFEIDDTGDIGWGDGTTAPDTRISRSFPSILSLRKHLEIEESCTVGTSIYSSYIKVERGTGKSIELFKSGETYPRISTDVNGYLRFGSGTSPPEVNLYRSGANTLKTDSNYTIGGKTNLIGAANAIKLPDIVNLKLVAAGYCGGTTLMKSSYNGLHVHTKPLIGHYVMSFNGYDMTKLNRYITDVIPVTSNEDTAKGAITTFPASFASLDYQSNITDGIRVMISGWNPASGAIELNDAPFVMKVFEIP